MCGDIVHTGDETPSGVAVAGVLIGELAWPFSRIDGSAGRIRTYDQPVNSHTFGLSELAYRLAQIGIYPHYPDFSAPCGLR
jgi:hypothetical protein